MGSHVTSCCPQTPTTPEAAQMPSAATSKSALSGFTISGGFCQGSCSTCAPSVALRAPGIQGILHSIPFPCAPGSSRGLVTPILRAGGGDTGCSQPALNQGDPRHRGQGWYCLARVGTVCAWDTGVTPSQQDGTP